MSDPGQSASGRCSLATPLQPDHDQFQLLLKLVDMRATPIGAAASRTFLKIVVVKASQRFQLFDDRFLWNGRQQAVAAQAPGERRKSLAKLKSPDHFHGLFEWILRARKIPVLNHPMHQKGSISCQERSILLYHPGEQVPIAGVILVTDIDTQQPQFSSEFAKMTICDKCAHVALLQPKSGKQLR